MLQSLDDTLSESQRQHIIDWVYTHQVVPDRTGNAPRCGGFQGSSTLNVRNAGAECGTNDYKWGHLAMTYTGIGILVTLGDDLSRLDRRAIIEGVAAVQKPDGNFSASIEGNEHDMRFVYCAAAICAMLNDWGTVDRAAMASYIRGSLVRAALGLFGVCVSCVFDCVPFGRHSSATTAASANTTRWNRMAAPRSALWPRCS